MENFDSTLQAESQTKIAQRAYEIWEQEGRPDGRDLEHWLRAESVLRQGSTAGEVSAEAAAASSQKSRKNSTPRAASAPPRKQKQFEMAT